MMPVHIEMPKYGDRTWVWLMRQENLDQPFTAKYGRVLKQFDRRS